MWHSEAGLGCTSHSLKLNARRSSQPRPYTRVGRKIKNERSGG